MERRNSTIEQISAAIGQAQSIAVISHYHPDADAYGSLGALKLALTSIGKQISLFNQDGMIERYSVIPGIEGVKSTAPESQFELWIVCDCGDFERVGKEFHSALSTATNVLNIDHHISNDYFGNLNLVDSEASSTCELLYLIIDSLKVNFTAEIGLALLAGIVGDTGSFRYSNTSPRCFEIASALVSAGAQISEVSKMLFGSYTASAVKMQAEAMLNLNLHFGGKVSEILVDRDLLQKHGACSEDTELLVERARDIKGVEVAFFIREDHDVWKVSLRSSVDHYDLSALAARFGGGGHRAAAAFRWRGAYAELRQKLLEGLKEVVG